MTDTINTPDGSAHFHIPDRSRPQNMMQQSDILARIAEALSQGLTPFQAENEAFSSFKDVAEVDELGPRHEIKPGMILDHQPGRGLSAAIGYDEATDGLRIALHDRGTASWFTLNMKLDLHTIRQGRYLGLVVNQTSIGFVNFRICLRCHVPGGLSDQFFREVAVSSGGPSEQLFFQRLDQDKLAQASAVEILFFFDGSSFDTSFKKIESILVR